MCLKLFSFLVPASFLNMIVKDLERSVDCFNFSFPFMLTEDVIQCKLAGSKALNSHFGMFPITSQCKGCFL